MHYFSLCSACNLAKWSAQSCPAEAVAETSDGIVADDPYAVGELEAMDAEDPYAAEVAA